MTFPLSSVNERTFDPEWSGEVFVCDIDRTYLHTRFSTLQGLAQIPFEFAIDKREIEGMAALLREVRRGPGGESRQTPLYFISASPAQLRPVIQRKMLLDGLEFDGTVFKDWVGVLKGLRLRRLKEQLGFKLTALLLHRKEIPAGASEVLIGDDLESDALTFTLFADAVAGRLGGDALLGALVQHGVSPDDAGAICELAAELPTADGVRRGYIRMERHATPEAFLEYWPHVAICHGAFQIALCLWQEGSISAAGVERVAVDLLSHRHSPGDLDDRLVDCCRRGLVQPEQGAELRDQLARGQLLAPGEPLPGVAPEWALPPESDGPWTPARLLAGGGSG